MNKPPNRSNIDTSHWASPEEYNRLIRSLNLREVRMVRGQFVAKKEYQGESGLHPNITFSGRFEVVENGFVAFHVLSFEGRCRERAEPILEIGAEYAARYRTKVDINEALFLPFLHLNLPVQTWPFFREFVQSSVARLQWPQVTLPSLHSSRGMIEFPEVSGKY